MNTRTILLMTSLTLWSALAGCAAGPAAVQVQSAQPGPIMAAGAPGTAGQAYARAKERIQAEGFADAVIYRIASDSQAYAEEYDGKPTWRVLFHSEARQASFEAIVAPGAEVAIAAVEERRRFQPAYRGGLGPVAVDSLQAAAQGRVAGLPAVERLLLVTPAEFAARSRKQAANPVWVVVFASMEAYIDAVTGREVP